MRFVRFEKELTKARAVFSLVIGIGSNKKEGGGKKMETGKAGMQGLRSVGRSKRGF